MKILHTADIHLREYQDERWNTLCTLIEIGKENKIELFVVSGDLFDREANAENLRDKIREIFSNNGFKIILIAGNHDVDSYKPGLYFGEDVHILTDVRKPFTHSDVSVWGMPFKPLAEKDIFATLHSLKGSLTQTRNNILLYHGTLRDSYFSSKDFGEEGTDSYMPLWLSYFKDLNFSYVLAGHFHSRFTTWKLENNGYFVYAGSPVSITEKETGQRKVNLFEVGSPPQEFSLDTPHFEELVIEFDPFEEKNPVKIVRERFQTIHPRARIILTVKGYINGVQAQVNERDLAKQIEKIIEEKPLKRCTLEFKDIHTILEDELFQNFMQKLVQADYEPERKNELRDLAIRAMIGVRR